MGKSQYTDTQKRIIKALSTIDIRPVSQKLSGILCDENNDIFLLFIKDCKGKTFNALLCHPDLDKEKIIECFNNISFVKNLFREHLTESVDATSERPFFFVFPQECEGPIDYKVDESKKNQVYKFSKLNAEFVICGNCGEELYHQGVKYKKYMIGKDTDELYQIFNGLNTFSPKLKYLVDHNFKSVEEVTLKWTRIAAIIAIVLAILSPLITSIIGKL